MTPRQAMGATILALVFALAAPGVAGAQGGGYGGYDGPGGYGGGPGDYGPGPQGPDEGGPDGPGPRFRDGGGRDFDGMNGPGMDGPGMRGGGMEPVAGLDEHSVSVNGERREYLVHVPANVAKPAPVVLVFHGGGGRPQGIARRTGMDEVADRNGFIVVYPGGEMRGTGRGQSWNVGAGIGPSAGHDVTYVQAILRDLEKQYPVDRARIYATGHSMGGVFAYRLACQMSDTFAAVAPVSATMVEPSCHPHSPVAVLHLHGAEDQRIPEHGGRGEMTAEGRSWPAPRKGIEEWSKLDGCSGAPTETRENGATCTTYAQCRAGVEYCVLSDEGHPWPSGAADRIWAFFAAHPKQ